MATYCAEFDGRELYAEDDRRLFRPDSLASKAVMAWALSAESRSEPKHYDIKIIELVVKNGQIVRSLIKTCSVQGILPRMTEEEFSAEKADLLAGLPEEFRDAISAYAWEEGHSDGFENVLHYVSDLADRFGRAIAKLTGKATAR